MDASLPTGPGSRARIRVGCAGWSIARASQPLFGEGDSLLARYATRFDAVEINSSFHRPHQHATYARWAAAVPREFRFSVKLPRQISHEARLHRPGPLLDAFLRQAEGLGSKLSMLLLQLPPSLAFDAHLGATFFGVLRRRWSGGVACEPRHASWFGEHADELMQRHGIARVAADPALHAGAGVPGGACSRRYWRWHGSPRVYYSAYDEDALKTLAMQVAAAASRAEAWVIFDNTAHGHATTDALRFRRLIDGAELDLSGGAAASRRRAPSNAAQ